MTAVVEMQESVEITRDTFRDIEIGDRVLVSYWEQGEHEYAVSEVVTGVVTSTGTDRGEAWFEVSEMQEYHETDLDEHANHSTQIYKFVPIEEEKD